MLQQVKDNNNKVEKLKKHNEPKDRGFGKSKRKCRRCGRRGRGIIRKYDLYYCRQCFREVAENLGFKKMD
ncbi:MAG: 30S ribosomal protein S14 [Candidatus Nanohaloarchaeota archaeon QJJ-9]|nr:30S ribosomal protein S14 [Candidatus Nanohaloarchaeota archaeon QJJ-9]